MFPIADVIDAVSEAVPERVAISQGSRTRTFAELKSGSDRLARMLVACGLTCQTERGDLSPWESGQAHVALFLQNCPEYLEAMLGCFKARAVPFNVNYRYVHDELLYLFRDAGTAAIIYERKYAEEVARLAAELDSELVLIEIDDGAQPEGPRPLITGALLYDGEPSINASMVLRQLTGDDLYILYTGGTTGMPKGVLWRQADILLSVLGGEKEKTGEPISSLAEFVARAQRAEHTVLIAPPFMHAAGQWIALNGLISGTRVVLPEIVDALDGADIWRTAEREKAERLVIVGDAFAVPLLDELRRGHYDLSSMKIIHSTGAALQPHFKEAFCELIEGAVVMKVSIVDLKYKTSEILKALDKNESVKILYKGKIKGIIKPVKEKRVLKIKDHPFFAMNKEHELTVLEEFEGLRPLSTLRLDSVRQR